MFPRTYLGGGGRYAALFSGAGNLEALNRNVIVDEGIAERRAETRAGRETSQRFFQVMRQTFRCSAVFSIRIVGRWPGDKFARHTIEPGMNLRRHVEIGIG